MKKIALFPCVIFISFCLTLVNSNAQNCPSLNVVGSFNNIIAWPSSYANSQNDGHCVTFDPPYASTLCFEYQVPFSDTVLFSLHLNACGSTSSINTGSFGGGCSGTSSTNATFTGMSTYDANCNLIANSAQVGYCGGAVSGDILTICFDINPATVCAPITICPTAFCGASSCITTLPIRLLSFNGKCLSGKTNFKWSTGSEVNNDYFTIERTSEGVFFEPVATITGAGNSNGLIEYEYELPSNGAQQLYYYRLKQTDFNGDFSYSDLISVNCDENNALNVFPNPTNNAISINAAFSLKTVSLINSLGEIVKKISPTDLVNSTEVDVSDLSKGIYILKVDFVNEKVVTEKLVVN